MPMNSYQVEIDNLRELNEELLKALKRILHWENTTQWLEPVPADMVEDARAAIRKAEG